MAELDPFVHSDEQESPNSATTSAGESPRKRRPRRRAGAPAGAPSVEESRSEHNDKPVTTTLGETTATVVADAEPTNFRARRLAKKAATRSQQENRGADIPNPDAENGNAAGASPRSTSVGGAKSAKADSASKSRGASAPEETLRTDDANQDDVAGGRPDVVEGDQRAAAAQGDEVEGASSAPSKDPASPVFADLEALASSRQDSPDGGSESAPVMNTDDFASLLFRAPVTDDDAQDEEPESDFAAATTFVSFDAPDLEAAKEKSSKRSRKRSNANDDASSEQSDSTSEDNDGSPSEDSDDDNESRSSRRRRRGGRGRRGRGKGEDDPEESKSDSKNSASSDDSNGSEDSDSDDSNGGSSRRRRRRRRSSNSNGDDQTTDDPPNTVVRVRDGRDEVKAVKGSTRLEAKKQRRKEGRESGRRRHSITESEFLARRESVKRSMIVRERPGRTQIVVLEDNILVEHYVAQKSQTSMVGNVYLGKVQNVLPSMEAAFVDIGKGRNAVLYAGEVNWDAAGLNGQPRRIEAALKSGDSVLVQVTKDPIGHKGARLTSQISLPGRYLVYVPGGSMTGISRKLPDNERSRLKKILKAIVPDDAGVIVRTAAEGASEEELTRDVKRLQRQWEKISKASKSKGAPAPLSTEPDLAIKVVRDIFNEDFTSLIVEGESVYKELHEYISEVAPDLLERVTKHVGAKDSFAKYRVDEQLMKAMDRKVYLPSGGSLVIDRTEAMTVVDVNTGKFTGSGGSLEETVTRNNLEAAEEIVRQLRLRDIGGIIVVDYIDMVLESNRDLVLRRMIECLSRDRTKHQVAEVTSLGLVQMTRKRVGAGLVETFSTTCEHCNGRGIHIDLDGQPHVEAPAFEDDSNRKSRRRSKRGSKSGDEKQDQQDKKTSRGSKRESANSDSNASSGSDTDGRASARDAVNELVDSKADSDVHRLESDEKSRALAAATIASIAAATSGESHPEVTVDGQVITTSDAQGGAEAPSDDADSEQHSE